MEICQLLIPRGEQAKKSREVFHCSLFIANKPRAALAPPCLTCPSHTPVAQLPGAGTHCNFKNKQTKQNQSKLKTKHYCIRLSLDWAVSSTEFSLWLWEGKLSVLWYCLLQDPTITLEEGSSHMQCQHLPTTQGPPPAQPFAAAKPALLVFADGCLSRE